MELSTYIQLKIHGDYLNDTFNTFFANLIHQTGVGLDKIKFEVVII